MAVVEQKIYDIFLTYINTSEFVLCSDLNDQFIYVYIVRYK